MVNCEFVIYPMIVIIYEYEYMKITYAIYQQSTYMIFIYLYSYMIR